MIGSGQGGLETNMLNGRPDRLGPEWHLLGVEEYQWTAGPEGRPHQWKKPIRGAAAKIAERSEPEERLYIVAEIEFRSCKTRKYAVSGAPHRRQPDGDNVFKAAMDGLHDVWSRDDGLICEVGCLKVWGERSKIWVWGAPLTGELLALHEASKIRTNAGRRAVATKYRRKHPEKIRRQKRESYYRNKGNTNA